MVEPQNAADAASAPQTSSVAATTPTVADAPIVAEPVVGQVRSKLTDALPRLAGAWAIGLGLVVLLGWSLDNETLKRVLPGLVAMNPVTALLFMACGAALWLMSHDALSQQGRRVARALAIVVVAAGLWKLLGLAMGWAWSIDHFLFASKLDATTANQLPNRMAPNTAFNFALLGLALLLMDAPLRLGRGALKRELWPFQWCAITAAFASLLALVGYAYGATYLYGVGSFIPMALHTALTFLILMPGVLYARPTRGVMAIVTSYSAGGSMARRLLPAAILIPAVLGWLRLQGERMGFYNGEVGVSLFAVALMLVFSLLVWGNARALFRTDIERRRALLQMRETSLALEFANEALNKRNHRMEADLDLASEIQKAFLPQQYVNFPRAAPAPNSALRFHHRYLPTSTLGGDFADILLLSDTQAGVFICDVMGHGVRSALVTAVMRGLVEELLAQSSDPGQFLTNLNRSLMTVLGRTKTPMFASAFFLVADVESGTLRYANAGHPSPLHLHRRTDHPDGGWIAPLCGTGYINDASSDENASDNENANDSKNTSADKNAIDEADGPVLGVFEDFTYVTRSGTLDNGDLLMLFTDGLFEVAGEEEDFDEDKLEALVKRHLTLPAPALFDAVLSEVRQFSTDAEFEDDVCLVGMEVARLGTNT